MERLEDPDNTIKSEEPAELSEEDQKLESKKWRWRKDLERHIERVSDLDDNKASLYGVIWGQCTNALQEVIKTDENYFSFAADFDCVWLLKKCKKISAGIDERGNKHYNLIKALVQFVNTRQHPLESNDSFRTRLDAAILTLELTGGKRMFCSEKLINAANPSEPTDAEIKAEEQLFKAMFMIMKSDPNRFLQTQESLRSGVILGRDEYPKTVTAAFELLQKTCPEVPASNPNKGWRFRRARNRFNNIVNGSPSFAQIDSSLTPGQDGRSHPNIVCHLCQKRGHYRNQCPTDTSNKIPKPQFCQYIMNQTVESGINKNWILLDTASTVSVSNNSKLVHDIRPCGDDILTIVTGGGTHTFHHKATFNLLPISTHYDPSSLANIISMKDVASLPGAWVTMDTNIERAIVLHYGGSQLVFQECADGLYFLDASQMHHNHSNTSVNQYPHNFQLVTTVADNCKLFTKREIKGL